MTLSKTPDVQATDHVHSEKTPFDMFIIGGGVNGCAIARDASGRGLKVALAEQGDLAQSTSSKSTKLFHGGLRYLEYGEIKLVRAALQEREILLGAMPHIAWPMRFVLPLSPDMRFDLNTPVSRLLSLVMPWTKGRRPSWMIRMGLWLYDMMGKRELLQATGTLNLGDAPEGAPLKSKFKRAFEYSDVWVDDARLVVLNAVDALENGANIMTRSRVTSAQRENGLWRIEVKGQGTFFTRTVINAGGPWVTEIIKDVAHQIPDANVRLVRGSHIITRKLYEHDKAYFLQGTDGRIIFLIPYEGDFTLIGTTEAPQASDPLTAKISPSERQYLLDFANTYLETSVTEDDVVSDYAGVRALFEDGASSATAATREYVLRLDTKGAPLLSVFGGKITTHRKLAEDVMRQLSDHISMGPKWTARVPLPGGDFPVGRHQQQQDSLTQAHPYVTPSHAARLVRQYGRRAADVFEGVIAASDMGIHFGATLYECEVKYLVLQEFARTSEDVIWRRTKLGLRLDADQIAALDTWMKDNVDALLPYANTA